jgi:hypothetical protein
MGTIRVPALSSLQVMLFSVSLPVFVTTAENSIGSPNAEASVQDLVTTIAGVAITYPKSMV